MEGRRQKAESRKRTRDLAMRDRYPLLVMTETRNQKAETRRRTRDLTMGDRFPFLVSGFWFLTFLLLSAFCFLIFRRKPETRNEDRSCISRSRVLLLLSAFC